MNELTAPELSQLPSLPIEDIKKNERGNTMENKQMILLHLRDAFKWTRGGADVDKLEYQEADEVVIIHFMNGSKKRVNVAMDSGLSLIRDVCAALM